MPRKFDFISPGILLNEVDNSVLPVETQDEGPLLIGRALTGPAMKPVRVSNLEDLYAIFGQPVSGKGALNSDVWRDGNLVAPTYAMFAAQAHLASNTTPVTFMRLVGEHNSDATADKAGWTLDTTNVSAIASNKAAYGLFLAPSASSGDHTGSLCAVFYTNGGIMQLEGPTDIAQAGSEVTASAEVIHYAAGTDIKIVFTDGTTPTTYNCNFNESSQNYIRNKFTTNAQKLFSAENFNVPTTDKFFLGETFEVAFDDINDGTSLLATIVPLQGRNDEGWGNRRMEAKKGSTGWFVNRSLDSVRAKLFKLHAHSAGEFMSANYWIQIEDLKLGSSINPNSTFTLKVMKNGTAVETFTGCNLNPSSENYISKKIGDQYQDWSETEKKYNVRGFYTNKSDYFYVEVDSAVENQTITDSLCLPIGFEMPAVHPDVQVAKSQAEGSLLQTDMFKGGSLIAGTENADAANLLGGFNTGGDILFKFPSVKLTSTGSNNGSDYSANSVFGLRHITNTGTQWNASYADVVRAVPASNAFAKPFDFSLEDIAVNATTGLYYWDSGTAAYVDNLTGSTGLFGKGIRKYAAPVIGGFDGVDIFRTDPFASHLVGSSSLASYERHTIEKALDIASDAEVVEYDLLSMPGQTKMPITNRIISICETRGDALAIVDLEKIYLNTWEIDGGGAADYPSVTQAVSNAQSRSINSSYAATYYPSVRMVDSVSGNNDVIIRTLVRACWFQPWWNQ